MAYTVALNQGQTYQLINVDNAPADLSGTVVTSNNPIAVFAGHGCANIPNGGVQFCDHVNEEMTPTVTWGKSFLTVPLATRLGGDTFRFLASTDATTVRVNGAVVATINRGQLFEQLITGVARIDSDKPILVAQYSNSTSFDGVTSDPFEMLIPPFEQFLANYTVTTPASGFSKNFINVVVPNSEVGSVTLDGSAVPAASYVPIPGSTFSGAQLAVSLGSHNLTGPLPFGTFVYGFDQADSYGYPGGLSLAPVASVTTVALSPKTATNPVGTQHCLTATVTDQNTQPLSGVRVDFAVTGANTAVGFANTNGAGTAPFCYTGTNIGTDSIVASVGSISDSASKTWVAGDTTPPTCVVTAVRRPGPSGHAEQDVTVQDTGSGLRSITNIVITNGTVNVPAFTVGTTGPVVLTAIKTDATMRTTWSFDATDVAGNTTHCA